MAIILLHDCEYLKDLLAGHFYAAVSGLRLLQGELVPENFQLLDQISLVAHRQLSITLLHTDIHLHR